MTALNNALGEFDLIQRFFKRKLTGQPFIALGIGDDCALLENLPESSNWAISTDMLVEGRHFLPNADPYLLGHKCLAVNLSDLAAMGAKPIGFTLALALPHAKVEWLEPFSKGLLALADEHQCTLFGGDTTAGPLTISITVFGAVPKGQALKRSQAKVGDDIWVSHNVGDARLALGALRQEWALDTQELALVTPRMHAPTPRVALGQSLLNHAHAAVDVSDGLLGDLSHILRQSQVCAEIMIDQVPSSETLQSKSTELRRLCTLMGGDDYELCFTAPSSEAAYIHQISSQLQLKLTKIGKITPSNSTSFIRLMDQDGEPLPEKLAEQYLKSFDHFK
jgi:thiamine-monophosphate kinase